ncbi:MAG: DUF4446 family protein [Candidatus Daviesbacteria bacterium]|nr:DUF4446 family protein [Candidatus Daviesbacteria bacterium]
MYSDWVGAVALGILVIWLGVLSFFVWQQNKFLQSLFPKSGERDIRKKFTEVIKVVEGFRGELSDLESRVIVLKDKGSEHIQRVELLRFNPYDDTGGNISFTVCFLDNKGTGIVLTSLHARSGTRVFGKEILLGKSKKFELSKEEEAVIKKAMTDKA